MAKRLPRFTSVALCHNNTLCTSVDYLPHNRFPIGLDLSPNLRAFVDFEAVLLTHENCLPHWGDHGRYEEENELLWSPLMTKAISSVIITLTSWSALSFETSWELVLSRETQSTPSPRDSLVFLVSLIPNLFFIPGWFSLQICSFVSWTVVTNTKPS